MATGEGIQLTSREDCCIMLSILVGRFESYDTPQLAVYSTAAGLNVSAASSAFAIPHVYPSEVMLIPEDRKESVPRGIRIKCGCKNTGTVNVYRRDSQIEAAVDEPVDLAKMLV